MKKYLFIIFFIPYLSFSQNEANIWYFGNNAGLDFNSGSAVALTDGAMQTQEGCASIANVNGELLFYTDGTTVWNKNHVPMQNGTGLNGSFSSTQSAIIVPKPDSSTIYYVFTVDRNGFPNGLQYSEVDMALDGGLGGVTSNKNILLHTPVVEKLTAVEHSNGTDIWVIAHENGSANFRSYLVTSSGVQTTPVVTNIGFSYSGNSFSENAGYMKVSNCGDRLAMVFPGNYNGLHLFDFDKSSGTLSNHINVFANQNSQKLYGVEFSPSGELIYITGESGVRQLDITLDTGFEIYSSFIYLYHDNFFSMWGALQLGPDGKIYVTRDPNDDFPDLHSLSVINNPNIGGIGSYFELDAVTLGTGVAQRGLPQFIDPFFYVKLSLVNSCFGEATQFIYNTCFSVDTVLWDFGDGNTSALDAPTHTYSAPGDYTVSVTVTANGETTTDTQDITIYEQPVAHPIEDQIACIESPFLTYTYDLTIHDGDILNGQDPNQFSLEYFAAIEDYNNDNPLDNPQMIELMVGGSADFVVSVQNINNSDCEDYTIIHVDVFQSPEINQNISDISVCDNESIGTDNDGLVIYDLTQIETTLLNGASSSGLTINYYTDDNFTNPIVNPENFQNSNPVETIYVEVFDNAITECTSTTSFLFSVEAKPNIQTTVSLIECDSDTDGIGVFNLTDVEPNMTSDFSTLIFTYYENLSDAENADNQINNENAYQNEVPNTDTVWVRVENDAGCFSIAEITLNVSSTQIPSDFMIELYQCEEISESGVATFDLTSANDDIMGLFPPGQTLVITYYQNENDALSDTNPIQDISNYQNTDSPNSQNIYIKVENTLDDNCAGLGHHITLHAEPLPLLSGPYIIEQCDEAGDGIEFFDTSSIEEMLSSQQPSSVSITYEDEFGNVLPSPLPNPLEVDIPIYNIFAILTIENDNLPNGGCSEVESIAFAINNSIITNPLEPYMACDDDGDNLYTFDTSSLEQDLIPNFSDNIDVFYEDENGSVINSPFPGSFTTSSQIITAYISDVLNPECMDTIEIEFIVTEQPVANTTDNVFVCDDANDGIEIFNLQDYNQNILGNQSEDDLSVLYFDNETEAINNNNPLLNQIQVDDNAQTIYVRVQHNENQECFDISSFQIGVNYLPIAYQPDNISVCDSESNDQIESIDLTIQNESILNGQSASDNQVTYYTTLIDAEAGINSVMETFTNTSNPQTLYARAQNINAPDCFSITSFEVEIYDSPILNLLDEYILCEGESVNISVDDVYDQYLWSTGDNTSSVNIQDPGTYELTVTKYYPDFSCESSKVIEVIESNKAIINDITIVDWSQQNNSITVFVEGNGSYEYSIDGINYQNSNKFTNLTNHEYLLHIRDINGCGEILKRVYLLDYPQFFTPNGDGINDMWQITNSIQEFFSKIYIFDRYGKLIAEVSPADSGWDGTMNGRAMPSDDYWFKVEREDGRVHSGHFTLKR